MSGPREKVLCYIAFRRVWVFANARCRMHDTRRWIARFEKPFVYRLFREAGGDSAPRLLARRSLALVKSL